MPGTLIAPFLFNIKEIYKCFRDGSVYDMGMIRDGKLDTKNFGLFCTYTLTQTLLIFLFFLVIETSIRANVNVGLIVSIMSITPFFSALFDALLFNQKISRG